MKFTKVHIESDKNFILKSNVEENAFLLIDVEKYFKNLLATTYCHALMAGSVQGNQGYGTSSFHRPCEASEKLLARHDTA